MRGRTLFGVLVVASAVLIFFVDYVLGPTAEYLNAYEMVRRTFSLNWPRGAENYCFFCSQLGSLSMAAAWICYAVESVVLAGMFMGIGRVVRYTFRRVTSEGGIP